MTSPFRSVLACGFALVATSTIASVASAQGRNPSDARIIDNYRLTRRVRRKVLPGLYAPGA